MKQIVGVFEGGRHILSNPDNVGQKANKREGGPARPQETQELQTRFGETQITDEKTQPRSPENKTRRDIVSCISESLCL